jgi:hypothetical protein
MFAPKLYIVGSLSNKNVPAVAEALRRDFGYDVFDDWFAAGQHADEEWRDYERSKGHTFLQALDGYAADHVFGYDKHHLLRSNAVVLIYPAGKSAFLELGVAVGLGKKTYVYIPHEPDRWDVMVRFADHVVDTIEGLDAAIREDFPV